MTKSELLVNLKDVPNEAQIFVYADHSQVTFVARLIEITSQVIPEDLNYSDLEEEIVWNGNPALVTGVRIS